MKLQPGMFAMRCFRPVLIASLFVSSLINAACSGAGKVEGSSAPVPAGAASGPRGGAVPILAQRAVKKPIPLDLEAIGSVEPSSTVAVHAQITGQLTSVGFKEGDDVKQGEVLFTLDRRPFDAAVKQAEANLQRDTAQAENAQVQSKRFVELSERGIATREQVETSRANADALEGTIAADRAALDNARIQLQYATITAPLPGRTGALMAHEGSLVRANDTTPLVVINQLSPINVTFAIPEAQLPALKTYMAKGSVSVKVQPPSEADSPAVGHVTFVDNSVDQTTGTIRVKGSFINGDHRLWPGQFVNVTLTLATDPNAVVVPSAAVQIGPDGSFVFVVKDDQTVEMRKVKVERTRDEDSIIASGLTDGETVVTDGHLRLVEGSRVSIRPGSKGAGE